MSLLLLFNQTAGSGINEFAADTVVSVDAAVDTLFMSNAIADLIASVDGHVDTLIMNNILSDIAITIDSAVDGKIYTEALADIIVSVDGAVDSQTVVPEDADLPVLTQTSSMLATPYTQGVSTAFMRDRHEDYVLMIGGTDLVNTTDWIYFGKVNSSKHVVTWNGLVKMPQPRAFTISFSDPDGYLFVVDGIKYTAGVQSSVGTLLIGKLTSDAVVKWNEYELPVGVSTCHCAFLYQDYLYVMGSPSLIAYRVKYFKGSLVGKWELMGTQPGIEANISNCAVVGNFVYWLDVQSNQFGMWDLTKPITTIRFVQFPNDIIYASLTAAGKDGLWIAGSNSVTSTTKIYFAPINFATGDIVDLLLKTNLRVARSNALTHTLGNQFLSFGGFDRGQPLTTLEIGVYNSEYNFQPINQILRPI